MKPQLITTDSGYHNADLQQSASRVFQGGSWKRQRTVVLVPTISAIPPKVYLSHCSLAFPPNQGVYRMLAVGMEVGDAYSQALTEILANPELSQWEYVLTMEADNCPPYDGLIRLIERMEQNPQFACIGGLYWCKGPGGCAHIWGDVNDPVLNFRPQVPTPEQLVECCGTSMGFNLWRMSMFRDQRLQRPWFRTLNGKNGEGIGTQDLAYWSDARKHGYRCAVDCSVKVGHYDFTGAFGPPDTMW